MPTWPLSRIQTFLANSVPVISASFLNSLQDAAVALFNGVISVKALVADATGANVVAPTAGDIAASRSLRAGRAAAAGTAPTGAVEAGELTKGLVPVGWCYTLGNGTLQRGVNVYAVSRTAQGVYEITFDRVLTDATKTCPLVTIFGSGTPRHYNTNSDATGVGGRVKVTVQITDSVPANQDAPFALLLMGE